MARDFEVRAAHPDAANNNPSENINLKEEHKHPNEVKFHIDRPKAPKPPHEPKQPHPPKPPLPQDKQEHKEEKEESKEASEGGQPYKSAAIEQEKERQAEHGHINHGTVDEKPTDGHEEGEANHQGSRPPPRLRGGPIHASGGGSISRLFNIASDSIHQGREMLNEHHQRRADNMSMKAANLGHIADTHHTMANEYEAKGQHDLAKAARRRGDQALVKHDKAAKIASKNFGKMFKADQRNMAEGFNNQYHSIRSMSKGQKNDAKNLASLHSDHINGHRPQSQAESNANKELKNRVMSNMVNRTNAVKAHDNFEHPLDRITPKFFNGQKHKNATTTMHWKAPSGNRAHDLSYSPSREPGFQKPNISTNLAF